MMGSAGWKIARRCVKRLSARDTAGANPVQPGGAGGSLRGGRWTAERATRRAGVGGDRRAVGPSAGAAI